MAKDIIYIDVEDDITAIIVRVKASKDEVVALVPPKRIGALQSVVNLRLLARAAKQSGKHLALITTNEALTNLASAAAIPVAKTLQSQPELIAVPTAKIDGDDDVIEGAELPVGEHAKQADPATKADKQSAAMAAALAGDEAAKSPAKTTPKKAAAKPKIPNFNSFRKKLFLTGGALLLLILFFIWANVIAPHATITVQAKTSPNSVNQPVTVADNVLTDATKGVIKAAVQQQQTQKSVAFTPTGKKDAGSKAIGTVQFSTGSITDLGTTIPAGTTLTSSSGMTFTTDSSVTITMSNYRGAPVTITATQNGSAYNAASGSMNGAPGSISATISGATSGGVTKMVTVVTAEDVQKAKATLTSQNTDNIKNDLKAKFDANTVVIDQSFVANYDQTSSSPDVGQEAAGQATLATTITYKLYGVSRDEVNKYLEAFMKTQLKDTKNQRVYDSGSKKASFQEATAVANGAKATLIATAKIGPMIQDQQVKDLSKGKQYGDIQAALKQIPGVQSIQVAFFPPWLNTVPNDNNRITVQFQLNESK